MPATESLIINPALLAARREGRNLSRDDVAEHLGRCRNTIRNWEQRTRDGKRHRIRNTDRLRLRTLYGLNAETEAEIFGPVPGAA